MKTALVINLLTVGCLLYSLKKDFRATKKALKIAVKKGISLAPWMIGIIIIIGILLSFAPPELIETYLGGEISIIQLVGAALAGTISMIPNLVSVPLMASLVESGASYTTVAAFLTTLIMVGIVTLPLEIKELGKKIALWRNIFSFLFAIIIALIIGFLM